MPRINPQDSKYDPTPVSEGEHIAVVEACDFRVSSGGNPMLEIRFRIVGHADPDRGKSVGYQYYTLTEKGRWKYIGLCRAIDPATPEHDPEVAEDVEKFIIGRPLVVTVEAYEDEWNGQTMQKLKIQRHRSLDPNESKAFGSKSSNGQPIDADIPF